MAGEQPQGPNFADLANQARLQQQSSGSAQDPTNMDDLFSALFGWLGNFFTFAKTKADSFFSTGIFAHVQLQQSFGESPMNKAAQSLSMRGGKLAQIFAAMKVDFSKITPPQIGGSMMDMSFASLGNLTPMQTPNMGMGAGMGMGGGMFG